ncbi:MAG TPA: V-type ATP synthase subunit A [Bacillota bacterium]|nr:V-type ATP synthase subunit A [Bacillota bacterium]HOK70834.1 V-type ATP synthase subunit A [Bacillota bacterium]HOO31203.1 V-type ATP synthase subunit A [Bacillota bacterium]HPZ14451.1 V-type ATP synthase subunit A [Bacillota bacterium]HQD81054.1 V-type ATP synthase subunit A [Bacillota bacterium]
MNRGTSVGTIVKVSGPLVVASGMAGAKMYDVVRVSEQRLIGEIIEMREDRASIQVYEETAGLGPGEPVYITGEPLSVELGPGLIGSIYDGIQRPLDRIRDMAGDRISRGLEAPGLDREREWDFVPRAGVGSKVVPGDILGTVQETPVVEHRVMVPPGISGKVIWIHKGVAKVTDVIAKIETSDGVREIQMMQRWPVRHGRPIAHKLTPSEPLVSGQRVLDTFFPVAKGGTACIPGPFGSGKTVVQHQLAKWADAEIVVYVGCGERGNEMTDVLMEFPELLDPQSGEPLMKRTVLIANTSDMPVAARESSVYTGITIAEYFRDMGYSVALMADSTSRWAEALREMSGRLEEMPGEEGYPAYLGSRVSEFYERAGRTTCLGSDGREGALTVVGAVSPPGGDLSEPVTQTTLRVVKVFWALDANLAYSRHFPAINWLTSYSLYLDRIDESLRKMVGSEFVEMRQEAMKILQEEASLSEIVRLVGMDALSPGERITMETARSIREDFLHQNAFHDVDTYTSLKKQAAMLRVILEMDHACRDAVEKGASFGQLAELAVHGKIARMKYIEEAKISEIDELALEVRRDVAALTAGGGEDVA